MFDENVTKEQLQQLKMLASYANDLVTYKDFISSKNIIL